jgi:hypothetical protein
MTMKHKDGPSPGDAFIDAGSLLTFVPELPTVHREDVLDSTLLAQLAADNKFSRFTAPADWFNFYWSTLGKLAWHSTYGSHGTYQPTGTTFTLEKLVLELLVGKIAAADFDRVEAALRVYNQLPDDDQRVIIYTKFSYTKFSYADNAVSLQVGVAGDAPQLTLLAVILQTQQDITSLFTDELLVSELLGDIMTYSYQAQLNEEGYAPNRAAVIKKLGARRAELILDLYGEPLKRALVQIDLSS